MDVAQSVAETTRRFWLAGLGAISMAEETGTNVFNALVEEGKSWEQARRERTEAATKQLRRIASEGAETAVAIEERVRDEIDGALERVGVPNRDDIDDLRGQVDDLGRKVDRLAEMLREEREASDE
jgi:poly(hydroxyalkanoate) granule-associated protein